MQKTLNFVRKLDLFAVRVQLSYKGQRAFNTATGGCISLLLVLSFLSYAAYELHRNLNSPELHSSQEFRFEQLNDDFYLNTKN